VLMPAHYLRTQVQIAREALDQIEQALQAEAAGAVAPLHTARDFIRLRLKRDASFPGGMFGDPRWDLLLVLFVAYEEGREVRQIEVFKEAGVAHTTGVRALREMEEVGLVVCRASETVKRKLIVSLSPEGLERMRQALSP